MIDCFTIYVFLLNIARHPQLNFNNLPLCISSPILYDRINRDTSVSINYRNWVDARDWKKGELCESFKYYNIQTGHRRSWHGPPPLFSNFLFTNLFSIKITLFFHRFFLILTCSCRYSYNLTLTSNCMCRPYIDTGARCVRKRKILYNTTRGRTHLLPFF